MPQTVEFKCTGLEPAHIANISAQLETINHITDDTIDLVSVTQN